MWDEMREKSSLSRIASENNVKSEEKKGSQYPPSNNISQVLPFSHSRKIGLW